MVGANKQQKLGDKNMNYFEGLFEESEIKKRYKELAKANHPDVGGNTEVMQSINAQYREVLKGAYQKAGMSISEIDALLAKDLQALSALSLIIGIEGIEVELCGSWIWVTGDTRAVKEKLKESNFRFSGKKKAWYWRSPDEKQRFFRGKKSLSLDDIRMRHGSSSLKAPRYRVA